MCPRKRLGLLFICLCRRGPVPCVQATELTVEAARRGGPYRNRIEHMAQAPSHAPELEAVDATTLVVVSGGGGGVRGSCPPVCMFFFFFPVRFSWNSARKCFAISGSDCCCCCCCWACQVLDPLVLNGAIMLMLGDTHPKVSALALDVIRAVHAAAPVVDMSGTGALNGVGHVMFSNLLYQVRLKQALLQALWFYHLCCCHFGVCMQLTAIVYVSKGFAFVPGGFTGHGSFMVLMAATVVPWLSTQVLALEGGRL